MSFSKQFCVKLTEITQRLSAYAGDPKTVSLAGRTKKLSDAEELDDLKQKVLSELEKLESEFRTELSRTQLFVWTRRLVLCLFVLAIAIGTLVIVVSSNDLYRVLGAASASGGVFAAANWLLAKLDQVHIKEVGFVFMLRRYKVILLACTDCSCVQKIAKEIADSFKALLGDSNS